MSSKSLPYLPLWLGDYLTGTQALVPDERYVYLELLMAQWLQGGRLPDDIRELRRLARAESWSLQRFRKAWEGIQGEREGRQVYDPKFLTDENGELFNRRLEDERAAATGHKDRLADAGRRGALRRWGCPGCRAKLRGHEKVCPKCQREL